MKKYFSFPVFLFVQLLTGCLEKTDDTYDTQNFTSIFDSNRFSASVYPLDFKQTPDGGYLILGERRLQSSNFRGIYLMKADENGKFVKEIEVEEQYVNPVSEFMALGDRYYFFCMDGGNLQAQLAEVDAGAAAITIHPAGGLTYPTAASLDNSGFVLLSYDHENKLTILSTLSSSGSIGSSAGYSIGAGDEVEEPIVNHFIRTGKRFPFQVGKLPGGSYFFNGFQNYTFSLVFTDPGSNSLSGIVQGQQDDGGFSAVYPLGGNKFAASRFNFGDNYFLPNVNLSTNGLSISVDLGGNAFPELVNNAPVRILKVTIRDKSVLIFASDTKSKQIGLFFYEEATGVFLGSRYFGFSNPFEVGNLLQTSDNGLAICGTTYLAGRFPRICLIKISEDELAGAIQ